MSAWLMGAGFTMITVLMSLYRFMECGSQDQLVDNGTYWLFS